MTVKDWLSQAQQKLTTAGIETARLDCLVLLEDITGFNRASLLANPDLLLKKSDLEKLNISVKQRTEHIPLAYIRGKTEFYGREFKVNKNVMVPRPESETMIEMLKSLIKKEQLTGTILDVGTGSGVLAITAKLELPGLTAIGIDIDSDCLAVSRENASIHNVKVKFYNGDLLDPVQDVIQQQDCIILANLPYVPDGYPINKAARHEPAKALFAGADGLDQYRLLFARLNRGDSRVKYVFTEALPEQHKALSKVAKEAGYELKEADDFIQLFSKKI